MKALFFLQLKLRGKVKTTFLYKCHFPLQKQLFRGDETELDII